LPSTTEHPAGTSGTLLSEVKGIYLNFTDEFEFEKGWWRWRVWDKLMDCNATARSYDSI